jgi:hypothetical protein
MAEGRDLTKLSAMQGIANWLCKGSGALVVCVIRVDDLAIAADPQLAPCDVESLLEHRAPEFHALLEQQRVEKLAKQDRQREKKAR